MRGVFVHSMLALIGLVLSYQTWTRTEEQERPAGEVTVVECDPSQIASMEMETPTHLITIAPKKVGTDTEYWITSQHKKEVKPITPEDTDKKPEPSFDATQPPAAESKDKNAKKDDKAAKKDDKAAADAKDADAKDKAEPEKEKEKQPRPYDPEAPVTFLASAKFTDFVKGLAPLRAMRGLGEIPKDKFAQFGFDKVGTYFRMQCGGHKVALDVGGKTFGASDSYVRDPKTKQSYLFPGQTFNDLQSAQFKFMQSDLSTVAPADADEAVIKAKDRERKLLHRNRAIKEEAVWVDSAAPDKRNELFGTWFQRLDRLKVKSFLDDGKQPGSDLQIEASAPKPVMSIEYKVDGKPKDSLELVRVDTKQGNFYYARSSATHRWVTLYDSAAKQVDDDVALVVGIEEAPNQSLPDDAGKDATKPAPAGAAPAKPAAAAPATPAPAKPATPPPAKPAPAHP